MIFLFRLQNARLENVRSESDKSREKLHCKIQKMKSVEKQKSHFLPGHAQHNKMHAYFNIRVKHLLKISTENSLTLTHYIGPYFYDHSRGVECSALH